MMALCRRTNNCCKQMKCCIPEICKKKKVVGSRTASVQERLRIMRAICDQQSIIVKVDGLSRDPDRRREAREALATRREAEKEIARLVGNTSNADLRPEYMFTATRNDVGLEYDDKIPRDDHEILKSFVEEEDIAVTDPDVTMTLDYTFMKSMNTQRVHSQSCTNLLSTNAYPGFNLNTRSLPSFFKESSNKKENSVWSITTASETGHQVQPWIPSDIDVFLFYL